MRSVWITFAASVALLSGCQASADEVLQTTPAASGTTLSPRSPSQASVSLEPLSPDIDDFYDRAAPAARAAIEAYLALTDEITAAAGQGHSRMQQRVTERWWPIEQSALAAWEMRQERTFGQTRFEDHRLQLARVTPEGELDIAMFGCVDSSRVIVLGPDEPDPPAEVIDWLDAGEGYPGTPEQWEVIEEYLLAGAARTGGRSAVVFWLTGTSLEQLLVDVSEDWWGEHGC